MRRRSSSATPADECPPITQADIDAARVALRARSKGGLLPVKQRVSIYLDRAVIEHFKRMAGERGYQTLINEALRQSIAAESMEQVLRRVVRDELKVASRKRAA